MRRICLAAVLVGLMLVTWGCGPKYPTTTPDIEGIITDAAGTQTALSILVEVPLSEREPPWSSKMSLTEARVTVNAETLLYDTDGDEIELGQLKKSSRVRVWFTGPVAESFPVQATASAVQLIEAAE